MMADETKKNPVDAVNEYSDKILSLYSTRFPFLKKYANGGFDSVKWLKVLMGLFILLSFAYGMAIVALWAGMGTLCCPPCQKLMGRPNAAGYGHCEVDGVVQDCGNSEAYVDTIGKCSACAVDAQIKSWKVVGDVLTGVVRRCWTNAEQTVEKSWKFTAEVIDINMGLLKDVLQLRYWNSPIGFLQSWFFAAKHMSEIIVGFVWEVLELQLNCTFDAVAIGWESTAALREMCLR